MINVRGMSDEQLAEHASAVLEAGDWETASESLAWLCALCVRGAGVPALEQTPLGASLRARDPEFAQQLTEMIHVVNRPEFSDEGDPASIRFAC